MNGEMTTTWFLNHPPSDQKTGTEAEKRSTIERRTEIETETETEAVIEIAARMMTVPVVEKTTETRTEDVMEIGIVPEIVTETGIGTGTAIVAEIATEKEAMIDVGIGKQSFTCKFKAHYLYTTRCVIK
jgi:hypothetical protein